jgi:hypothetical protein
VIDLTSDSAIENLHQNHTFSHLCLSFIQEHIQLIHSSFEDETFPPSGHWFLILEANDQLTSDSPGPMIFSCAAGTYSPEYIERYTFDDGNALFKIYVMLDNECSMTFFTLQGIHSTETEKWLLTNSDEAH